MKTRIITAIVGIAALLLVLLAPWTIVFTCAVVVICGVSVLEVLSVTDMAKHRGLKVASILFAVLAPFFDRLPQAVVLGICLAYMIALVAIYLIGHNVLTLEKIGSVFFMTMLVSLSLSCASYLRNFDDQLGLFFVMLAMVIAWLADSGAYFVGTFFGKHKLCPKISPKKTVEGLIGGIVCSVGSALFTTWIFEQIYPDHTIKINYIHVLIFALIGSLLSVVGDLFASVIKRQHGVKDFGKVFPGHGGMMDRFDSLLLVFPLVYLLTKI